jgi:hypothetical protein
MVIEKLKINCNIKNKTWTNPKIKGHKKSHELLTYGTTDTPQKTEHMYLKFLTPVMTSSEIILHFLGFKYVYKPRNINVVFSQYGSY